MKFKMFKMGFACSIKTKLPLHVGDLIHPYRVPTSTAGLFYIYPWALASIQYLPHGILIASAGLFYIYP